MKQIKKSFIIFIFKQYFLLIQFLLQLLLYVYLLTA